MRDGVCGKLHAGRSHLLFALQKSSVDSQLFVQIREILSAYTTCFRRPRYGGPGRNITITFGTEKLEWFGYRQ